MSKFTRVVIILIALSIMTFAGVQLGSYFYDRMEDSAVNDELSALANSPITAEDEAAMSNYGTDDESGDDDDEDVLYQREDPDMGSKLSNYTRKLFGKAAPGQMPTSGNQTKKTLQKAQTRRINFAALKKRNKQIVAWINIPNTGIDYAVVKGTNNTQYLTMNAVRKRSSGGSIFLDSAAKADFNNSDSIVYGHQMKDKSMFGSLNRYRNSNYKKKHQYIYIYTPSATRKYKVSSTFGTTSTTLQPDRGKTQSLTLVTCNGKSAHYAVRAQLVSSKKPGAK